MLDDAALFGVRPHKIAGGVLEEHNRVARLIHQLDELRDLGCAVSVDGTVV